MRLRSARDADGVDRSFYAPAWPENDRSATRTDRPLASGLRIVEIGESISAAVAGMVFADYGADVLMIEPPNGSRLREAPAFAMWSRGKRSVRLDLTTTAGP